MRLRPFLIAGGLFVAALALAYFGLREVALRGVASRDIVSWKQLDSAIRIYHADHGSYPASLQPPDFQPQITAQSAALIREGRLIYYVPAADSPPTFILVHLTTPRGDYASRLDGEPVYSPPK